MASAPADAADDGNVEVSYDEFHRDPRACARRTEHADRVTVVGESGETLFVIVRQRDDIEF